MHKSQLLYWGYNYQDERAFKDKRKQRTAFIKALRQDAKEAGLI